MEDNGVFIQDDIYFVGSIFVGICLNMLTVMPRLYTFSVLERIPRVYDRSFHLLFVQEYIPFHYAPEISDYYISLWPKIKLKHPTTSGWIVQDRACVPFTTFCVNAC